MYDEGGVADGNGQLHLAVGGNEQAGSIVKLYSTREVPSPLCASTLRHLLESLILQDLS